VAWICRKIKKGRGQSGQAIKLFQAHRKMSFTFIIIIIIIFICSEKHDIIK